MVCRVPQDVYTAPKKLEIPPWWFRASQQWESMNTRMDEVALPFPPHNPNPVLGTVCRQDGKPFYPVHESPPPRHSDRYLQHHNAPTTPTAAAVDSWAPAFNLGPPSGPWASTSASFVSGAGMELGTQHGWIPDSPTWRRLEAREQANSRFTAQQATRQ